VHEAELARRAAEQQTVSLAAALAEAEHELAQLRQRYVALQLEARQLLDKQEQFRLQAASLLLEHDNLASGRALNETLDAIEDLRVAEAELCRAAREFDKYLDSVLEVMKPSQVLRQEIRGRYNTVLRACDRLEQVPSLVAGRDGRQNGSDECRILAVNDDLRIIVLNAGSQDGVREGARFTVQIGDDKEAATVRVLEARVSLSAAVVEKGRFKVLAPGMAARRESEPEK